MKLMISMKIVTGYEFKIYLKIGMTMMTILMMMMMMTVNIRRALTKTLLMLMKQL